MRKSIESLGGKKYTGGRLTPSRMRRKSEIDRYPHEPILGKDNKIVIRRVRGGTFKSSIKNIDFIIVNDTHNKKNSKNKNYSCIREFCQ
jgi:small subunit ribosomal protein S8e